MSRVRPQPVPTLLLALLLTVLLVLGCVADRPSPGGGRVDDVDAPRLRLGERPVLTDPRPDVIAHRGASGHRPEHTLAAYRVAIRQGADHIEPDVVVTKDGVLVVRHEHEIGGTTDVAERPEFADRRTTRRVDGEERTGWFVEDFTLAELRTLRARERMPLLRPHNTAWDGHFRVPTLDQVLELARAHSRRGREVGVFPEVKHPAYFDSIGLPLEPRLAATLRDHGLDAPDAPVVVQSFEAASLRELDARVEVPLAQLVGEERESALARPRRLARIASYADGVAVPRAELVDRPDTGAGLVEAAHAHDLDVHVWTVRAEETDDLPGEVRALDRAGVDGIFTDQPGLVARALGD